VVLKKDSPVRKVRNGITGCDGIELLWIAHPPEPAAVPEIDAFKASPHPAYDENPNCQPKLGRSTAV
jgi:hypothetical protein